MKMFALRNNRCSFSLFLILLLVMIGGTPVKAEEGEDKPTVSVSADILSQYIWRGIAYSKSSAVIQPSLTAGWKGFSLNLWGNFDTDAQPPSNPKQGAKWNETDLTFSYTREIYGGLSGTVGGIYYALDGADDSFEVYGGLSYAFPWFTVGVTGYREVSHYPGWWIQFDLSRAFKLPCWDMSLDLGTTFYYLNSSDSSAYPDPDNPSQAFSGMLSGQVAAALNIPVGKYLTLSPRIGYAFPLSSSATDLIRTLSWDGVQNHVFGGLRLSAAF